MKKGSIKNVVFSAIVIIIAVAVIRNMPDRDGQSDQRSVAPTKMGVIADGAFTPMDKANFPKSYKKWGSAGIKKINDLGPKAAQLIASSGTCDTLNIVALSDERSKPKSDIVFFGDCANGKRFYISQKDVESGAKAVSVNDLMSGKEDGDYIQTCFDQTAASLKFPSSFDPSWLNATVYHAPTGNVVVQAPFEAKNGMGNTLPFKTRCVFDDQGMSPPEIARR